VTNSFGLLFDLITVMFNLRFTRNILFQLFKGNTADKQHIRVFVKSFCKPHDITNPHVHAFVYKAVHFLIKSVQYTTLEFIIKFCA